MTLGKDSNGTPPDVDRVVADWEITEFELRSLAEVWMREVQSARWDLLVDEVHGGYDWQFIEYANRRLDAIRQLLGDEKYEEATAAVEARWTSEFQQAGCYEH